MKHASIRFLFKTLHAIFFPFNLYMRNLVFQVYNFHNIPSSSSWDSALHERMERHIQHFNTVCVFLCVLYRRIHFGFLLKIGSLVGRWRIIVTIKEPLNTFAWATESTRDKYNEMERGAAVTTFLSFVMAFVPTLGKYTNGIKRFAFILCVCVLFFSLFRMIFHQLMSFCSIFHVQNQVHSPQP